MKTEEQESCEYRFSSILSISLISSYSCQFVVRYKTEIVILGVLSFSKATRTYLKIAEDVLITWTEVNQDDILTILPSLPPYD